VFSTWPAKRMAGMAGEERRMMAIKNVGGVERLNGVVQLTTDRWCRELQCFHTQCTFPRDS
jgi:hypothetical protein